MFHSKLSLRMEITAAGHQQSRKWQLKGTARLLPIAGTSLDRLAKITKAVSRSTTGSVPWSTISSNDSEKVVSLYSIRTYFLKLC